MSRQLIATTTAILLFGTAASAASPPISEDEAAAFVQSFCTTLVSAIAEYDPNAPGVWPPDDPSVFGPLVTPELAEMIERAYEHSSAFEEVSDEKPPLGDGIPWTAGDTASGCAAGTISGTAERPEVEVHYQFYYDPSQSWADRLVLSRHTGEWRVDDVLYGVFDYASGLRSTLTEVINEPLPQAQVDADQRCGWYANPSPGNLLLTDAAGDWWIQMQGRPDPEGIDNTPAFDEAEFVETNVPGTGYGYGCACLTVEADADQHRVIRVIAGEILPLAVCRNDPSLPDPDE